MPLASGEFARVNQGRLEVRGEPLRLNWSLTDLVSSDGHRITADFSCSVRALPDPAERQMLEEVFLSSNNGSTLRADAVARHFHNVLRSAGAKAAESKAASDLLGGTGANSMIEALRTAANKVAFASGLELLPPFHVDLESPTFEQQRLEALQRSLAEQRAAGQVQHFQRATELLKQFQTIQQNTPGITAGDVLKQLSSADQGMMLQTLLMASAKEKKTEAVWAVAGPHLLKIDPRSTPPTTQIIPLPSTLGPLRSVQPAQGGAKLLVGARAGVFLIDPSNPDAAEAYADPTVTSALGFSRGVVWNEQLWACHSEAGLVCWNLSEKDKPALTYRPDALGGAAPRNLQVIDPSRALFSSRNQLMQVQRSIDGATTPSVVDNTRAEIIAILPDRERLFVVLKDGTVQQRDNVSLSVVTEARRGGELCSACLMPWLGSVRLLLATDDGPIACLGPDDDLLTQFLTPYRGGLKALAAAADVIAGVSEDRQRLLLWQPWNPRTPVADLYIPSLARHRVADVEI